MISYVAKLLFIFASSVQNVIIFTSVIGETIISVISWICFTSLNIFNYFLLFFQIVYEDNSIIITEELPNYLKVFSETILHQFYLLWNFIDAVCHGVYIKLSAITANITWPLDATVLFLGRNLLYMKSTLIYFGNTVWFIITFLPVHMPHVLQKSTKYILDIIMTKVVDGYMLLLKFTNFLTEVPIESFLGLSVFIILVRMLIHFRTVIVTQIFMIYWSLLRNFMYYFYMIYNYFTNAEVRVITQLANGEVLHRSGDSENLDNVLQDETVNITDSLCVICQERQKCVLTLPCRHVCLCIDCCRRLYGYQRTCPICRTFIYHSVTVYL